MQIEAIRLKAMGIAFMRAFSLSDGKAVVSWIKLEDFEKLNADPYDAEGIVNQLLYVKEPPSVLYLQKEKMKYA